MMMRSSVVLLATLSLTAACDRLTLPGSGWSDTAAPAVNPQSRPDAAATTPRVLAPQGARSAAAFDTTTDADKAAALAAPAGGTSLGQVVVSLGNPAEQGFWLRSSLVSAPRPGTVRLAAGRTVQVELLPAAGGGAQLSLAAFRALELGLTELPTVTVLAR